MEIFLYPESWIALLTLTFLEVVLGIDNIIFISIVTNRVPRHLQPRVRNIGLMLAMGFRIGLLLGITYIIGFTRPLFTLLNYEMSARDLILLLGGAFLLLKSIFEIHHKMEGSEKEIKTSTSNYPVVIILQIIMLDLVFSFDSILTAIGLTDIVLLMIIAIVVAITVMMLFSGKISNFINNHPTLQILALSFLILIGFTLIIDAMHYHVPKGYIYFSVFFSLIVELINMRVRKNISPVSLRKKVKN